MHCNLTLRYVWTAEYTTCMLENLIRQLLWFLSCVFSVVHVHMVLYTCNTFILSIAYLTNYRAHAWTEHNFKLFVKAHDICFLFLNFTRLNVFVEHHKLLYLAVGFGHDASEGCIESLICVWKSEGHKLLLWIRHHLTLHIARLIRLDCKTLGNGVGNLCANQPTSEFNFPALYLLRYMRHVDELPIIELPLEVAYLTLQILHKFNQTGNLWLLKHILIHLMAGHQSLLKILSDPEFVFCEFI